MLGFKGTDEKEYFYLVICLCFLLLTGHTVCNKNLNLFKNGEQTF